MSFEICFKGKQKRVAFKQWRNVMYSSLAVSWSQACESCSAGMKKGSYLQNVLFFGFSASLLLFFTILHTVRLRFKKLRSPKNTSYPCTDLPAARQELQLMLWVCGKTPRLWQNCLLDLRSFEFAGIFHHNSVKSSTH